MDKETQRMQDNLPEHPSELWEKNPVVAAAMLGALRENPQTRELQDQQRIMLVERALRDQCRGDHAWLSIMVPRLLAGEIFWSMHRPRPPLVQRLMRTPSLATKNRRRGHPRLPCRSPPL
jgi:hypothetical protein